MMMKSLYSLILILVGIIHVGTSQAQVQDYSNQISNSFKLNPNSIGIKGSPMLFEKAQIGNIVLSNGKSYSDIPLNINLVKGEVFIQTDGVESEPFMVRNWESLETTHGDRRFFKKEQIGSKLEIVEILWKGEDKKIVAVLRKVITEPQTPREGYSGPRYDEFKFDVNYLQLDGLNKVEIKTTKQGLKAFAGPFEKDVQELIKKEKLKLDRPEDFKQVVLLVVQNL